MPDANAVYTLLKEVFLIIEDGDKRFFQEHDLTVTRFYTMWHLRDVAGLTLRDLSDRMLCDKSNITRVVKGLEGDDLVYRKDHENDGRAYRVYLTEKGLETVNAIDARHIAYNRGRLTDKAQFEALENTLSQLKASLVEIQALPVERLVADGQPSPQPS